MVPGRPTNLDKSRTRAYCACSRCGWGLFGHFFSHLSFLNSFSLCLKGPLSPKTTNQIQLDAKTLVHRKVYHVLVLCLNEQSYLA